MNVRRAAGEGRLERTAEPRRALAERTFHPGAL